jgi:hypothetical protein
MSDNGRDPSAAAGLRLRPRDVAKIGQLVLDGGRWGDRQVVPAAWLKESVEPRIDVDQLVRYGYFWWLGTASVGDVPPAWIAAFGNGGQRLFVLPTRAGCGRHGRPLQPARRLADSHGRPDAVRAAGAGDRTARLAPRGLALDLDPACASAVEVIP